MHPIVYRNFSGRLPVKSVAFGSTSNVDLQSVLFAELTA